MISSFLSPSDSLDGPEKGVICFLFLLLPYKQQQHEFFCFFFFILIFEEKKNALHMPKT